jgi:hypothetical protein
MNDLKLFLSGKKTYLSALIGILYLAGVWAGLYEFDERILAVVGFAGLAALRAAVTRNPTTPAGPPLAALAAIPFAIALLGTGCSSIAPGNDPLVVNAERTTTLAVDTFDLFVKWEYDNRTVLSKVPQIRKAADRIRTQAPTWLSTARNLTKAYKANRTLENKANLETAITVLRTALAEARVYLESGMEMAAGPPLPPAR